MEFMNDAVFVGDGCLCGVLRCFLYFGKAIIGITSVAIRGYKGGGVRFETAKVSKRNL